MFFDNLAASIGGEPGFRQFSYDDTNPVSGSRKQRTISAPNVPMQVIHKRFLELLEPLQDMAHDLGGNASENEPYKNACAHVHNRYFYQTDLRSAYPSVSLVSLADTLVRLEPKWSRDEVENFLAKYCVARDGGLLTGAPASPILFDIYASVLLDAPLRREWPDIVTVSTRDGLDFPNGLNVYTRYTDDLTFSSEEPIEPNTRRSIRAIVEAAGFQINHRKSTYRDLAKGPVIITGIGLEFRAGKTARLFLPRHYLSRIRGMLHLAVTGRVRVSHQEIGGLMGVFWAVFGGKYEHKRGIVKFTAAEQKILHLHRRYRSLHKLLTKR